MRQEQEGSLVAEYAYDIEAQSLFVAKAQRDNRLFWGDCMLFGKDIVNEWGQRWVVLNKGKGGIFLFYGHCNLDIYQQLKDGQTFSIIDSSNSSDIFTFSKVVWAVARVFTENGILYESPGFDGFQWDERFRTIWRAGSLT